MRAPVSWLRELVGAEAVPESMTGGQVAAALVKVGLEEEGIHGGEITGPLVVGKVLEMTPEPQKNGKTINWCQVDVGEHGQRVTEGTPQGIVCGAHNFSAGDLVVCILPGGVLPGPFPISARKTYGHVSNGMICSAKELGLGEDHDGIIVLSEWFADQPEVIDSLEPGQDAISLLGLAEEVVEVNVTPDRGYAFSMRGIARDLALSLGVDFTDPIDAPRAAAPAANDSGYEVRLEDDAPINGVQGCDRYVARIIRGIDVTAESPSWLKTRVTQMGMRPISLAVDVTNYVMLLTGQPLHAFDLDKLSGSIVVRRARAGEKLTTLDDIERTLDPEDLLITDAGERPLVIAGVMGGETCEIDEGSTNVLIEAAHFDPISVARSARRHRLPSEAAKRFERGVDPEITAAAAQLAVELLVQLGGGTVDDGVTDVGQPEPLPAFTMAADLPTRLVGLDFSAEEVSTALRRIGCDVAADGETLTVTPPSWRPDLRNGPDLVEEVARSRGYDAIPSVLPQAPGGQGLTAGQRARRLVAATLAQQGLTEVLSYPFTSAARHDALQYAADDPRRRAVTVANPLSDEAPILRTSVLDTLADVARRNVGRGMGDVAVYELGLVYEPGEAGAKAPIPTLGQRPADEVLDQINAAVPAQPRHAAGILAGASRPAGPWGPAEHVGAADAVAVVLAVARALGETLTVAQAEHAPFHPGRCASLALADGTVVAHAGELHPKAVAALELPARTAAFEIDLDALTAAADEVTQASKLSTLPVARTDVALVVGEDVPAAAVEAALRQGAGEQLETVELFDIYRGDQVGEGRKSLAYRLTFRPVDKTLTTAEVSATRDRAVAEAAKATGAEQRT
ncbi:phenylalanine--tRNA ligase subunit beta [Actinomycetota bacterium]